MENVVHIRMRLTMLSNATLALIVSEIVAGYATVVRVKGKLKVVGAR